MAILADVATCNTQKPTAECKSGKAKDSPGSPSGYAAHLAKVFVRSRGDLHFSRHVARNAPYYIVRDSISFQNRVLSPKEYRIFAALDGKRMCQDVFQSLIDEGILRAEDEQDFYGLILSLHQSRLLELAISDGEQLYERYLEHKKRARRGLAMQVLCWRQSVGNPDQWLNRITPFLSWLFTWQAGVVWGLFTVLFLSLLIPSFTELFSPIGVMLTQQNLLLSLVIYCILKAWHELGHAIACKTFGGQVPDWGILFVVGTPCTYVDASSAWSMPSCTRRIIISLAGIYFESLVALVSAAIWIFSDSLLLRSVAQHVIVVSTLTTILVNANPLMKFDGYFVLSDLIGIYNLQGRAVTAWRWTLKRIFLGLPVASPEPSMRRCVALACFGALTETYRVIIVASIVGLLFCRLPILGIFGGLAYLTFYGLRWVGQLVYYLCMNRELIEKRQSAIIKLVVSLGFVLGAFVLPIPLPVRLDGLTGYERCLLIRSPGNGLLLQKIASAGNFSQKGDLLAELNRSDLRDELVQLESQCFAANLKYRKALSVSAEDASSYLHELTSLQLRTQRLREEVKELEVSCPETGRIINWEEGVEVGAPISDGQVLARLGSGKPKLKVLLNQRQLQWHRPEIGEPVSVVFPWDWSHRYPGTVQRIERTAHGQIKEMALTQLAGGEIEIDTHNMRSKEDVYVIEVLLEDELEHRQIDGARARLELPRRSASAASWVWFHWLDFYYHYLRDRSV